jgi:transposase
VVTVQGMSYPCDLTDEQWELLEPVFNAAGKRERIATTLRDLSSERARQRRVAVAA